MNSNCSLARCLGQRTWLPKFRVIASQSADWRGNPLQIFRNVDGDSHVGPLGLLGMTCIFR